MALQVIPAWGDQLQDAFDALKMNDFNRAIPAYSPTSRKWKRWWRRDAGEMYSSGSGVAKDEKAAVTWWKRAADKGEPIGSTQPWR